jgi:hypothetical protein
MISRNAVLAGAIALLLVGCKSDEQKAAEESAKKLEEASRQMEEAAKSGQVNVGDAMATLGAAVNAANSGRQVETVDFRQLKDMLPGEVGGLKRSEATGEKNAAMGMQVSTARARYSDDQGKSASVTITDIGSMTGLAAMATFAWASAEFDRDTGDGYEKTTRLDGYKAVEKWNNSSKSGEISVIVGDRFVVTAEGNDVGMDALKDAVKKADLGKLNSMKNQGVK